nr:outer membrane beta-barrel protein [Prevotella sp.]
MNKTDWTDKLRDRLENYEAPVGDDLWTGIEQSLVQRPAVLCPLDTKSSHRMSWRWWGMAAAVAALVVGGSYVYLQQPLSPTSSAVVSSVMDRQGSLSSGISKDDTHGNVAENPIATFDTDASLLASHTGKPVLLADNTVGGSRVDRKSQGLDDSEPLRLSADGGEEPVCDLSPVLTEPSGSLDSSARSVQKPSSDYSSQESVSSQGKHAVASGSLMRKSVRSASLSTADPQIVAAKSATSDGWSMKLYAENGLPHSMGEGGVSASSVMSDAVMKPFIDNTLQFVAVKLNDKESLLDTKHHFPVSVGVQVGVPLFPRLSLTTGVVYTQTSSDFTYQHGNDQTVVNQSLHYVGIPIGLSYEVWGISCLHTYVNVGGEGAVNVKNKTLVDGSRADVGRDNMQWSAHASLGVQFDVIPQLGIYAEPGAKYYFDNGSNIDNVFKDKKLNFNFQFGLRWKIGK